MSERLFLLDGMALAYRAYFAFIRNPLRNSKGENISAIFGFANSLLKILDDEKPEYIAVVFDTPEPTFRHKAFADYKATRENMPEEMNDQLPKLKEMVECFNIPISEFPGYEADDIIGTYAKIAEKEGVLTYMVTADKDFMQLVSKKVRMYNPLKRGADIEIIDIEKVKDRFGVGPEKVVDVLGLMGDTSDNVPGVKGVGEKTAIKLIQDHGSIADLYENLDQVKGKLREKLEAGKEDAFLSRRLVTIDTEVPVETNFHELKFLEKKADDLISMFKELEFKTLIPRVRKEQEAVAVQSSLFDSEIEAPGAASAQSEEHSYMMIKSRKELDNLIGKLRSAKWMAFDTETTHLEFLKADLLGISVSVKEGEAFYVPISFDREDGLMKLNAGDRKYVLSKLKPVFEDSSIRKIGQNIKYDLLVLRDAGIEVRGIAFDTMVAAYLIRPEGQNNIDAMAMQYLNYRKIPTSDLIGTGKNQKSMADVELEAVTEYGCEDADVTFKLKKPLDQGLDSTGTRKLFEEVELPLIEVLADMEQRGVWLDLKLLNEMSKDFAVQLAEIEKAVFEEAGETFNLNSPQQLGQIMFEKMQLHKMAGVDKPRKTKTGQYATDINVLERLNPDPDREVF